MTLETSLCGIALRNPVLAASGTFGYGVEFEKQVDLEALGGFVVKGLSREPIEGNPPPRLYETRCGMMNSIGLQNIGARASANAVVFRWLCGSANGPIRTTTSFGTL